MLCFIIFEVNIANKRSLKIFVIDERAAF